MTNHVLLDYVSHRGLRINKQYLEGCGFDVNVARAYPIELAALQADYPLFFIRDASTLALTIERQPFLIGFQERMVDGGCCDLQIVRRSGGYPAG